jgi:hypothetical protein
LVVPVGHPLIENAYIEWRISYSFAERLLIFHFNITQLRSIVILKMIKKTFFQPIVGEKLISCHCKSVLLYTIAQTCPSLWAEDHLFHCILNCLSTLHHLLSRHFCPNFFDTSVNVFLGKMSPLCCNKLNNNIKKLRNDNLNCLFQIETEDLGNRMLNVKTFGLTSFSIQRAYILKSVSLQKSFFIKINI